MTEDRGSRENLSDALERFKDAAGALLEAWQAEGLIGDEIDGYPAYLPSFDEFTDDALEMEVHPEVAPREEEGTG